MVSFIFGFTTFSILRAAFSFSSAPTKNEIEKEQYYRLQTIFAKNAYGYRTRFFHDFDIFLECVFHGQFLDEAIAYIEDNTTAKEIEDQEGGLEGDFANQDLRNSNKDMPAPHGSPDLCLAHPARSGTNYPKTDDLSIYKVHPKGYIPKF